MARRKSLVFFFLTHGFLTVIIHTIHSLVSSHSFAPTRVCFYAHCRRVLRQSSAVPLLCLERNPSRAKNNGDNVRLTFRLTGFQVTSSYNRLPLCSRQERIARAVHCARFRVYRQHHPFVPRSEDRLR